MLLTAGVALASGCKSTQRADRSAAIAAQGNASIESWRTKNPFGMITLSIFKIDGALLQKEGMAGVYPLTPGEHDILVYCSFGRAPIGGLVLDAGEVTLQLNAQPGKRYGVRGRRAAELEAFLWIEDLATGQRVTDEVAVPLASNPQEVPPFLIPIPVTR